MYNFSKGFGKATVNKIQPDIFAVGLSPEITTIRVVGGGDDSTPIQNHCLISLVKSGFYGVTGLELLVLTNGKSPKEGYQACKLGRIDRPDIMPPSGNQAVCKRTLAAPGPSKTLVNRIFPN